jgi:hypothetical protein
VSLVTKCVTGDFLQLTFNDVGREGGWVGGVKKCFLSRRQTALLSAEGKNDILGPMVRGLHYDATTYAAIIGQLESGSGNCVDGSRVV